MATFAKRSINKAKRFAGIKNNKTHNSTVTLLLDNREVRGLSATDPRLKMRIRVRANLYEDHAHQAT